MTDTQQTGPHHLKDYLAETRRDIRHLAQAIEAAREQLAALQSQVEHLRAEEAGLELALRRRTGEDEVDITMNGESNLLGLLGDDVEAEAAESSEQMAEPGQEARPPNFVSMPRTDAVAEVLSSHPEGITPTEVREELHRRGRDDDYPATSAALAYLKRKGRAHPIRRGVYAPGPASEEA